MSFNDLNDLEGHPAEDSDETQSPEFINLTKAISAKVFKLSSNVTLVHRYIGLLGTPRDTEKMRTSFMDTLTRTQKLTKELLPTIRELSHWDAEQVGPNGRYEQKKLTAEYQKAALDFQNAQRLALEKQKDYIKDVKAIIEEENRDEDRSHRSYEHHHQQEQRLHLLDNSEIEFNEQLIEEREQEIQGIEMGINELNEVFKDLATIIVEQGTVLGILTLSFFLS
jgi:hypothetical protein